MTTRVFARLMFVATLGFFGTAQAALFDRGGGLVYDSDLDITWLADANYAKTSGYDADGQMTWSEAMTWATNLDYGGHSDWYLPVTVQPDASCSDQSGESTGHFCTGSAMGHLFYDELGGVGGTTPLYAVHNENYSLFQNFEPHAYWSSTEYPTAFISLPAAWTFTFGYGGQASDYQSIHHFALAVHDGDIAAIPETDTWAMLLVGLGMVGAMARRTKQIQI